MCALESTFTTLLNQQHDPLKTCKKLFMSFDAHSASIAKMQAYSECVQLAYPASPTFYWLIPLGLVGTIVIAFLWFNKKLSRV